MFYLDFLSLKHKLLQAKEWLSNEIQTDSISGAGGSYDDFIELYNKGEEAIDLSTWSIQKQSQLSSSLIYKSELSGIVPPGGYLLLVRNHSSCDAALKDMADVLLPSSCKQQFPVVLFKIVQKGCRSHAKDWHTWAVDASLRVECPPTSRV